MTVDDVTAVQEILDRSGQLESISFLMLYESNAPALPLSGVVSAINM
jgi:hypothetical protein